MINAYLLNALRIIADEIIKPPSGGFIIHGNLISSRLPQRPGRIIIFSCTANTQHSFTIQRLPDEPLAKMARTALIPFLLADARHFYPAN